MIIRLPSFRTPLPSPPPFPFKFALSQHELTGTNNNMHAC